MQCHIWWYQNVQCSRLPLGYPWLYYPISIILSEGSLWEDKSKLNFTRFQTLLLTWKLFVFWKTGHWGGWFLTRGSCNQRFNCILLCFQCAVKEMLFYVGFQFSSWWPQCWLGYQDRQPNNSWSHQAQSIPNGKIKWCLRESEWVGWGTQPYTKIQNNVKNRVFSSSKYQF